MTTFAHSLPGRPSSEWEPLEKHLAEVGDLAGEFASAFGAGEWGELLGRWHDLGKYSDEFQRYIGASGGDADAGEEGRPGRVDHSTFGARHAAKAVGKHAGQVLAFCLAGHHAGLADGTAGDALSAGSTLQHRLVHTAIPEVVFPAGLAAAPKLALPFVTSRVATQAGFEIACFTRMLFSCLIDADRTCTERFCDPTQAALRAAEKPTLGMLSAALDAHLEKKQAGAAATAVNTLRREVLADCMAAGGLPAGFFSLNVPTGGGKTLSSLAFALHHAAAHGLRRVVMAIPFTSIIEQTADNYRAALGSLAELGLIEHHTNLDAKKNTRQHQLATENWDAPLIVTTNVQLYESLFAAATTPCRKLHRLTKSVIILDEAQTLPVEMLAPTLAALKELVAHYGCTVVLCTATQPALEYRAGTFEIGIPKPRAIIRDEARLFAGLRRVEVTRAGKLPDAELVTRLGAEPSVLCVVNTRPHAAKVYSELVAQVGRKGCFHLSTFMCAQHRRDTLATIRKRLADKKPTRIISTQLIEAGVDIDLPVVYRAAAGFDSAAQAAGRCNREGTLEGLGRVYVFDAEQLPPPGSLRAAAGCAAELAAAHPDPLAPSAIEAYFSLFYWHQGHHRWDKDDILGALAYDGRPEPAFKFRQVARDYQLIEDDQQPILVPYNAEAEDLLRKFQAGEFDFTLLRTAQKYTVSVRGRDLEKLAQNTAIFLDPVSQLWLLTNPDGYSKVTGLLTNAAGMDPSGLIY